MARRTKIQAPPKPTPIPSLFRPHPWHGLEVGPEPPELIWAFIEITPFDLIKYEVDKQSGYVRIDRPQRGSNQSPTLYGFIPRTYCAERVRKLAGKTATRGDGDPLDICVISERPITRAEILIKSRVIGGLQMIDNGEADDKIVAVVDNDYVYGTARDLDDIPKVLVERLVHYFTTYKLVPGQGQPVGIAKIYGQKQAFKVIEAAMADYQEAFGPR